MKVNLEIDINVTVIDKNKRETKKKIRKMIQLEVERIADIRIKLDLDRLIIESLEELNESKRPTLFR